MCTPVLRLPVARVAAAPAGLHDPAPLPDVVSGVRDAAAQGRSLCPPRDCLPSSHCGVPRASLAAPCPRQLVCARSRRQTRPLSCDVWWGEPRLGGTPSGDVCCWSASSSPWCLMVTLPPAPCTSTRPRAGSRTCPPPGGPLCKLTVPCACISPASSYGPKRSTGSGVLPTS